MDAREIIKVGMSAERTLVVPPERTVGHFVRDMPMVYATPMMIMEMEMASADAIKPHLALGWITVGTEVDIRHLAGRRGDTNHGAGDRGGAPPDPFRGRGI
jgi:fluoroacetyl-CoA thioesterase